MLGGVWRWEGQGVLRKEDEQFSVATLVAKKEEFEGQGPALSPEGLGGVGGNRSPEGVTGACGGLGPNVLGQSVSIASNSQPLYACPVKWRRE